jgi:small GTP-binding protein
MTTILENLPNELKIIILKYLIIPSKNILLVGNEKVGKTCFINRLKGNTKLEQRYYPTNDNIFHTITENIKILEYPGQEIFQEDLQKATYLQLEKVTTIIIMVSITDDYIFQTIKKWKNKLTFLNKPFMICINKTDIVNLKTEYFKKHTLNKIKNHCKNQIFYAHELLLLM